MNKIKLNLSLKLALLIMFVSLIGISSLGYLSYYRAKKIFKENSTQRLYKSIEKYKKNVKDSIKALKYDITILSFNSSVLGFLRAYEDPYKYDENSNKTYSQFKKEIEALFHLMINQNKPYFQIRIIDARTGQELIKVVKNNDKVRLINENALQNKFNTDYVQKVLHNNKGIYISDIDLNREYGVIEFPAKPTLRIAKLFKINNKNSGIIVINANVFTLFDFKKLKDTQNTYIANSKGDYLLNPKEQYKEFGFEFGKDYKIYDDFKELKSFFENKENRFIISDNNKIIAAIKIYFAPDNYIVAVKTSSVSIFDAKSKNYIYSLIYYILIITLVMTIITAIIVKKFMRPIVELKKVATEIAHTKGKKIIPININSKDEIGDLAESIKTMYAALLHSKQEIEEFANKLEIEVEKKTKELQELNLNLQNKVEEKISEIRKKDKALIQQSKMAAMGEMIGAIAHQWRQPINSLAINIQLLIDMAENNECDIDTVSKFVERNMKTIQFMSDTIDDFRNFLKEDKEKTVFDVKKAIESTVELQHEQLKNYNIDVKIDLKPYNAYGYISEFMQVVLNIIANARDAIIEKRAEDNNFKGCIEILDKIDNDTIIVIIKDNGGGIPPEILNKIYEPYFTTKDNGTGIGLYMSSEIMKNMNGGLDVINEDNGAKFMIKLELWKG